MPETAPKPKKYRNEETTVDGIRFDSKREADRYGTLKLMERGGAIRNLELQPRFQLHVKGELICVYVADFAYHRLRVDAKDGWEPVVEDVKGVRTPVFKLKKKLMHACLGIEVIEV